MLRLMSFMRRLVVFDFLCLTFGGGISVVYYPSELGKILVRGSGKGHEGQIDKLDFNAE